MHYANGREAKVGDQVVGRDWAGRAVSGVVVRTVPGNETCNIDIVPAQNAATYTSKEFLHVDDAVPSTQPAS
jgi:hypothetical protein